MNIYQTFIAFTDTRCSNDKVNKNSLWELPNSTVIHQVRNSSPNREGKALYVYNCLNFETHNNKIINNNNIECLNIDVLRKTSQNVIISFIYRLLRADDNKFLDEMKDHRSY